MFWEDDALSKEAGKVQQVTDRRLCLSPSPPPSIISQEPKSAYHICHQSFEHLRTSYCVDGGGCLLPVLSNYYCTVVMLFGRGRGQTAILMVPLLHRLHGIALNKLYFPFVHLYPSSGHVACVCVCVCMDRPIISWACTALWKTRRSSVTDHTHSSSSCS